MRRGLFIAAAFAGAVLGPGLPAAQAGELGRITDRVAAVVNDDVITVSEVYELGADFIEEAVSSAGEVQRHPAEHAVLQRLIERRLVEQQIQSLKLDVTEQELDRAIDDVARRNGMDRDQVRSAVEEQGMDWDTFRAEQREQLREMKFQRSVLQPRITITEDELRDAFLRSGGSLGGESASVQGLLLSIPRGSEGPAVDAVRARAQEAELRIRTGEAFSTVAEAYDEGTTRASAGEMGEFERGQLVPELDGPVFAAELNEPFIVELPTAILVMRVTGKRRVETGLEGARAKLTDAIFSERMQREQERWAEQARRAAVVRVLLPGGDGRAPRATP